jgi:hypothetical protein
MFLNQNFIPFYTIGFYMNNSSNNKYHKIINIIENLFSFNNLNNDIYLRSNLNDEGYLNYEILFDFNEIKRCNIEKKYLFNLLLTYKSNNLEVIIKNNNLLIRNKKWNDIKKYLNNYDEIIFSKVCNIQSNCLLNSEIFQFNIEINPIKS